MQKLENFWTLLHICFMLTESLYLIKLTERRVHLASPISFPIIIFVCDYFEA